MGYFKLKCLECNEIFSVEFHDADRIDLTESREKYMGEENYYTMYFDVQCPKCGEDAELKIGFWEYPKGILEYLDEQFDIKGNIEIIEFSVEDVALSYLSKKM